MLDGIAVVVDVVAVEEIDCDCSNMVIECWNGANMDFVLRILIDLLLDC